jgi:hypothetical protein
VVEALVVLVVPVPVAGAQAVVAQVEASAAGVAGKDTDTLKIHIFILKKGSFGQNSDTFPEFWPKLVSVATQSGKKNIKKETTI